MRLHGIPYLAFIASFMLFYWLLQGAGDGIRGLASLVLALLVWNTTANKMRKIQATKDRNSTFTPGKD